MPYERGPSTGNRFLDAELEKIRAEVERIDGAVTELIAARVVGGIVTPFAWDDTGTTPADPGAGFIRGNANNLNGVSALYISKTLLVGGTVETFANQSRVGEAFILSSIAGDHVYGTVTAVTDNGAWVTWAINNAGGAGNPAQGDVFELRWYPEVEDYPL